MEIGNEISQKIRSAIKAKLVDLGSYVDDELPDYIMVMVANKKSKAQMTDDLNLFLGANTDVFTSWLHEILCKLETATVQPSGTASTTPAATPVAATPAATPVAASVAVAPAVPAVPAKTTPEKPPETSSKKSKKSKKSKDKSGHHKSSRRKDKDKDRDGSHKKTPESGKVAAAAASATTKPHESAVSATTKSLEPSVATPASVSETHAPVATASVTLPTETLETASAAVAKEAAPDQPADAITLNPETHDFLDEEIDEESKKEEKPKRSSTSKTVLKTTSSSTRPTKSSTSPVVASSKAAVEAEASSPPPEQITKRTVEKTFIVSRPRSASAGATLSSVTVVPKAERKRKGPGSVVGQVIKDEEEEEDDMPSRKKVASTVELHRRPSLPVSKQANTSLLKKAVSAAQESTKDVAVPSTREISRSVPMVIQQSRPTVAQNRFKIIRTTGAGGANKTLLVRAVNEANESTISARPLATMTSARPVTSMAQARPVTSMTPVQMQRQTPPTMALYSRTTAAKAEVAKAGLVSRSRLREVAERDYDTQEFMTVETSEPQTVQMEEYYADDEEQEEDMESTVDSRHIFVEDLMKRGHTNIPGRAVEVTEQKMAYSSSSPEPDVMMVLESKPATTVDKHVVVKREKPIPPRPVSPKFIVTLDGAPQKSSKNRKQKTKAAARIAPRMDITRTIDNSGIIGTHPPPIETEYIQSVETTTYQDEYSAIPSFSEPTEYVYLSSQMSPTAQPVFSPTSSMTMVADAEQIALTKQMQLEEQVVLDQQQLESATTQRQQPSERCRFWPACKNGNDCPFVHPTQSCKTFPNCKFGDKCVFIHPNCKYDARCTKTNCPFTHASKRSPSAPALPPRPVPRKPVHAPPPSRGPSQTVCRFFPKCVKMDCPFLHPKACRFGRSCSRKDCRFMHPQVATGAALRWSKEKKETHISERGFAVKAAEQQILPS